MITPCADDKGGKFHEVPETDCIAAHSAFHGALYARFSLEQEWPAAPFGLLTRSDGRLLRSNY